LVVAVALLFQNKNPTAGLAMGFVNFCERLEPDRRAGKQRVQQQV